jgi:hypothetical protein
MYVGMQPILPGRALATALPHPATRHILRDTPVKLLNK